MFIYTGKLHWEPYGVNELLVVVLPNGPARVGDRIFTHSQWTVDAKGNKKKNWSQYQTIDKVTRTANADDTFYFGQGYYSFEVQAQQGYRAISLTMSNPGGSKKTMTLERTYLSSGDGLVDPARIWTGRLDWPQYADNEPFMAIVPEGFGPGKPFLAFWQWTVDQANQHKVNCIHTGTQQAETPAEGSLKFTSTGDYTMACTWNEETEELAVHMEGPDKHSQDLVPLRMAALVKFHSHDVTPPQLPGESAQLEVHYPQAEAALARIHSPMPFPPTLVETLTHTASFLDQAGYQAKYAVDRYHDLDRSYHALMQQVDNLNRQIGDLNKKVAALTGESDDEKKQIDGLQKKLTEALETAAQKEAELTKQVQDLQMTLAKEKTHDAEDHKALDAAHEQIRKEQEEKTTLQKQVVLLQSALAQGALRIKQFQTQVAGLVHDVSDLHGLLSVERTHNAELQTQVNQLKAKVASLEADAASTKKSLARITDELKEARADAAEKDSIIEGLETGIEAIKKDRDAKKHAYEELKKSSSATIQELEDEIAKLKAHPAPESDPIKWPFEDGWPFPQNGRHGGCWPSPDDMLRQMSLS